jgi:hypothetical protein
MNGWRRGVGVETCVASEPLEIVPVERAPKALAVGDGMRAPGVFANMSRKGRRLDGARGGGGGWGGWGGAAPGMRRSA